MKGKALRRILDFSKGTKKSALLGTLISISNIAGPVSI
jgi:hypothetical protein